MTRLEIAKLVGVLIAAYPNSKPTSDTTLIYERMLADLDYAVASAAVEQLLAISKWMPTVAEIRERAASLEHGEVRPGGEAWGLVLKAIGLAGRYREPMFDDPVVGECVKALGWTTLCDSEDQTADRARFIELYDRLAVSHRRKMLSDGLPATQRFRALQAAKRGEARPLGEVIRLALVEGKDAT